MYPARILSKLTSGISTSGAALQDGGGGTGGGIGGGHDDCQSFGAEPRDSCEV